MSSPPKTRFHHSVLALGLLMFVSGCYRHAFRTGIGATTDDRPVYSKMQAHFFWGLLGENEIDTQSLCPEGHALIREATTVWNSILQWVTLGIFTPTDVTVYCRDDAYRAAVQAARAADQARFAAEEEQRRIAREQQQFQQRQVQIQQQVVGGSMAPPAAPPSAPVYASPPSSPQTPHVTYERRTVQSYLHAVTTHEQCDEVIPRRQDEDPMFPGVMTATVRRPCHECIASNKTFYIYDMTPYITSSCE